MGKTKREILSVSNSELQKLKQCRRAWWLAYYRRLKPNREAATGPFSIGNRVHACLAAYYNGELVPPPKKRGKPAVTKEQLALDLHDWAIELDVERCCNFVVMFEDGPINEHDDDMEASIRKEAELSRLMLEGYFEWLAETGVDEGHTVIGTERAVEATITTPWTQTPVRIRGKLDLLVRREHEGDVMFKDHKTVQEFTTPTKTLHLDEQMLMYHLLLLLQDAGAVVADGAVYNMLRKVKRTATSKPPFYDRFEVRHSPQEVESFLFRLEGELEEIIRLRAELDALESAKLKRKERDKLRLRLVYPTPTRDCSWRCEFYAVCHLIDRPQDKRGEPLIEDLYHEGDPYARYDGADA